MFNNMFDESIERMREDANGEREKGKEEIESVETVSPHWKIALTSLQAPFLVRAHGWVEGSILSQGVYGRQPITVSLSLRC